MLQAQKNLWRVEDNDSLWRQVWRVKAPPKALNLIWRALSHCLPNLSQLWTKCVPVVDICPVCNQPNETIFHGLVTCPFAMQCWRNGISSIRFDSSTDFSG